MREEMGSLNRLVRMNTAISLAHFQARQAPEAAAEEGGEGKVTLE
jgi:hypothetical protein